MHKTMPARGQDPTQGCRQLGHCPLKISKWILLKSSSVGSISTCGICTHSGWAEAYPTYTEWAQEVARALLRDIIPRHAASLSIGSDNGPAFVSEIIQTLSRTLGIKQKLHTAYRPQSSGKVERMSWTLKTILVKLYQETQLSWVDMLPLALL